MLEACRPCPHVETELVKLGVSGEREGITAPLSAFSEPHGEGGRQVGECARLGRAWGVGAGFGHLRSQTKPSSPVSLTIRSYTCRAKRPWGNKPELTASSIVIGSSGNTWIETA